MGFIVEAKRTGFYQELTEEKRKEYLSLTRSKFLPTIDNLYFNVFIMNDKKGVLEKGTQISNLLNNLQDKKDEVLTLREPLEFAHGLYLTIKSVGMYNICVTESDLYDIFFCKTLPNDDTPRIQIQLRALGLWTRGIDEVMVDAYKRVATLLSDYDLTIERVAENRIDYCYHTNAVSSPNKIFKETDGE